MSNTTSNNNSNVTISSLVDSEARTSTNTTINTTTTSFVTALIAGGCAGTSVDVALYPIDTLKTRLQAPVGFWKAGGFRGVYNGLGAVAAGSAPGAALFFSTYEYIKAAIATAQQQQHQYNGTGVLLQPLLQLLEKHESLSHMLAATCGEATACLVRVPTEVVKAKMQTAQTKISLMETVKMVLAERPVGSSSAGTGGLLSNVTGGLYRGYGITLFREIPFAVIQFPMYEKLKVVWAEQQGKTSVSPLQAAACGSFSGGIAAGLTTPLDVLKTRLMLGTDQHGVPYTGVKDVWQRTLQSEGPSALWHGFQPRVMWISIGGFVFFGAYEAFKTIVHPFVD